ncbi:MAG: tRNA threonylcarbamoyladenosine dehydratase [Bacteroidaceae bacterium]|nr:tRNA threonylcarbamoyladenosine dehydratase [Bacteroidaceae bacterium]
MTDEKDIFNRTERLVGKAILEEISRKQVIIFGIGGVGSWCAESLVRSGIRQLTIVDADNVCATNVNRQSMATMKTIGMVKVDALKSKLLDINPQAEIKAIKGVYKAETRDDFQLERYDYVVDAIDSLECKKELILHATSLPSHVKFFSSMGAALKMDPTLVEADEFWNVKGCPLARALRQKFKRAHMFPKRKFQVVYSPEVLPNLGQDVVNDTTADIGPKASINGTMAHITAIFGFTLAGLILQDIYQKGL